MGQPGEITRLLQRAEEGDAGAVGELFVLVEEDLRRIARQRKRDASLGAAVDASTTALVDDAFIRLVGQDKSTWQAGDRGKFFAYISNKIHDFLIAELRKQQAQKRGGDRHRAEFDPDLPVSLIEADGHIDLLIDLKAALHRLQVFAREDAILFRLRFLLECTFEETANIMGVSKTEAVRSYQRTQLWLRRELKEYHHDA